MNLKDTLLPYQKTFADSPKRFKLFLSGRQLGKSHLIGYELVKSALSNKNGTSACVSTGARAASELLLKAKLYAEAVKIATNGKITYEASHDAIKFSTGSRVLSLPNNPDGLRGGTYCMVAMDEAAFIEHPEDVFQAIAPTLTRNQTSKFILASTPAGMNGWFYEKYCEAIDSDDWYVQTTSIETAIANGLKVDINELHKLCPDPEVFNQEYMCMWSKEFGVLIDFDNLDFYNDDITSKTCYLGMDIGRKSDKTAITIIKQYKDIYYLDNVIILSKCPYDQQIQTVKDLHSKYNFTGGFIDEGGIGSAVAEQITKTISSKLKGISFTGTNKTPMYEALRAKIFDHKIKFKEEFKSMLKNDFNNVHRIVSETGVVRFEAGRDQNGHSDVTSSIVLALEASRQMPASFSYPKGYTNSSAFGMRSRLF